MEEIWREIKGYGGLYLVSDAGRVARVLKPQINKYRRLEVDIVLGGTRGKHTKIHRVVAETFIPNPDNKGDVDHINCNPTDNRAVNLRWATRRENLANMRVHNKSGLPKGVEKHHTGKFLVRVRPVIKGKRKLLGIFDTAEEAKAVLDTYQKGIFGDFWRS